MPTRTEEHIDRIARQMELAAGKVRKKDIAAFCGMSPQSLTSYENKFAGEIAKKKDSYSSLSDTWIAERKKELLEQSLEALDDDLSLTNEELCDPRFRLIRQKAVKTSLDFVKTQDTITVKGGQHIHVNVQAQSDSELESRIEALLNKKSA